MSSQYVGSTDIGNYPMWDSSVLYQAPPPSHAHVSDHGLYRQPCALLHQRCEIYMCLKYSSSLTKIFL